MRASGFTLVELMVVVALVGILTAVILPEMRGTHEHALLRSSSRELMHAFSLAHSRAVSFNQAHRVRLEPGRYLIEKQASARGRQEFVPLRDLPGSEGKLDSRITIEFRMPGEILPERPATPSDRQDDGSIPERDETITFHPDGTADAKEVLLQDRQGFRLALRINPTTARVRVVEVARQ